jgi:hypothetical protein
MGRRENLEADGGLKMDVSWAKIKVWRKCRRAYFYRYIERLTARVKSLPLFRGSIIGECLDQVAEKKKISPVLEKYEAEYKKLLPAEKEMYGPVITDVKSIVERYQEKYRGDGLKYPEFQGRKSEFEVNVDLGRNITFTGKIDKIPIDRESRVLIMDHKSHKVIPDDKDRLVDLQLLFYVWAAPLSGLPKPDGILWDYIRTKPPTVPEVLKNGELTQRKDIDTDYDTYRQAIVDNGLDPKNYVDILNRLKDGPDRFFKRVLLPTPSKTTISSIVRDLKETALEIKFLGEVSSARTMDKMTCKTCEFFAVCQAELRGLDADFIRKSDYKIREPNHDRAEKKTEDE